MNDTTPEAQARFDELMAQRTGSERVEMAFSMLATAKAIVASSIRAAQPDIGDRDLMAEVFKRMYVNDFSPDELDAIARRIAAYREPDPIDALSSRWSAEDADTFDRAVANVRRIDDDLWTS
jgi:hypothetical protein